MPSTAQIRFHPTQFPAQAAAGLLASLRRRRLNHKYLYDGFRQTAKWLALHRAWSPWHKHNDFQELYQPAFRAAVARVRASQVTVIGLGCGSGEKDRELLRQLRRAGKTCAYVPVDVSAAMVLEARARTLSVVGAGHCHPFVCDLAEASDLPRTVLPETCAAGSRIVTCFGLLPNFEPESILPKLKGLLRRGQDCLLLSANLAPGSDYRAGLRQILPQYDNPETRDWLETFLQDLGVAAADGTLEFNCEDRPRLRLKRVVANFHFARECSATAYGRTVHFRPGQKLRVFFSYRHRPELLKELLQRYGLNLQELFVSGAGEEAVGVVR